MPFRPRTPVYELVDRLTRALTVVYVTLCCLFFFAVILPKRIWFPRFTSFREFLNAFAALWVMVIALFALTILRNRLRGSIFPDELPTGVIFRERFASGRSFRSMFTRFGGASNCLEVVVTEDELWTRLGWPGRILFTGAEFGLENRIPLSSITSIARSGIPRRRVTVSYRDAAGTLQRLEVNARNMDGFLLALQQGNPGLPMPDGSE